MTKTPSEAVLHTLPLVPRNPLPLKQQLKAIRIFHSGCETLRDAGGPVTRIKAGPRWLVPEIVVVTSPQGAHDVLGRSDAVLERTRIHGEMRRLIGANLFDVMHDEWLPKRRRLQPLFTKKRVQGYGGQMAHAAETVAQGWQSGTEVDLDAECRKLALRALGSSVLGLNLDAEADRIGKPLRVMLEHVGDRGVAPVRFPGWVPTPARVRARAASAVLRDVAAEVLRAVKADPNRDAPLVRAFIEAKDPVTGSGLTDDEIRDELIAFMTAGHDTSATTLAYSLWQLGRHPEMQERVRAEAAAIGDRELAPGDVANLGYTMQVLHEALRLCPPAAASGRLAMEDIDVDGYRVQKGTMVAVAIYAIQRDPALWERSTAFDPDRFRPEVAKSIDRWQFLPFGAGPRTCVGDHFAMLEMALTLSTVVRRTEIRSLEDDFPLATPFTMVAGAPIRARVIARPGYTTENAAGSAPRPVSAVSTVSP